MPWKLVGFDRGPWLPERSSGLWTNAATNGRDQRFGTILLEWQRRNSIIFRLVKQYIYVLDVLAASVYCFAAVAEDVWILMALCQCNFKSSPLWSNIYFEMKDTSFSKKDFRWDVSRWLENSRAVRNKKDPPTFNNNNSNSNIRFQSLAWLRGKLVSAEEEPFQSQSHSRQKALSNFRKEGWIYKTVYHLDVTEYRYTSSRAI